MAMICRRQFTQALLPTNSRGCSRLARWEAHHVESYYKRHWPGEVYSALVARAHDCLPLVLACTLLQYMKLGRTGRCKFHVSHYQMQWKTPAGRMTTSSLVPEALESLTPTQRSRNPVPS
jgi:hypothetical protein